MKNGNNKNKKPFAVIQSQLCTITTWLQVVLCLSSDVAENRQMLKGCFDRTNCLSDHDERGFGGTDIKDERRDTGTIHPCRAFNKIKQNMDVYNKLHDVALTEMTSFPAEPKATGYRLSSVMFSASTRNNWQKQWQVWINTSGST